MSANDEENRTAMSVCVSMTGEIVILDEEGVVMALPVKEAAKLVEYVSRAIEVARDITFAKSQRGN